ncbi:hypothetical protein RF11_14919 [Thelohanellus kitauei]|uniref:ISXO2-like transposase domain-containing protein n=1 Tax=Thelohanellus kitauei TaxID=669202 RepID=A0A0C2N901_THEKT|nr:hypothetical protein RF11_02884 [Thelohanellus kitauei]KII72825.1 hypothetical protein RF11_14919 [Thelohanellus kitauei]
MGVWVLGGMERITERKAFLVEAQDRTEEIYIRIISNDVFPGSTIITDCVRSYTANYSFHVIDPSSGAHINTIEDGNVVKNNLDDFLGESLWLRKHSSDMWGGLLGAIKEIIVTYE